MSEAPLEEGFQGLPTNRTGYRTRPFCSSMIPAGFISNLLDRADIVDVVQRYVPLQKNGRN